MFTNSEHREPDPAGRDRGATLAAHPAEVRGCWGAEGDRRVWTPWRRGEDAKEREGN